MPTRQQLFDQYRLLHSAAIRHWQKGAVAVAIGMVIAVVGTLLMPRSYYSEARLFVRFGRENQVDPTASGSQMVSLYESRESEINSLIEILKSRAILDRVVEALGPGAVLYGSPALTTGDRRQGTGDRKQPSQVATRVATPSKSHQLAVARLAKTVVIAAPRKSNIITVACKAKSPALAQQIVAKLIEVYQDEHVRVHRSPESYAFFEDQAKQSVTAWQTAADKLRDAKDRLGIVTIEGRRKHLDDTMAEINFKRLGNQAEAKTALAKVASLEAEMNRFPATLVTQETTAPSAAADGMRQSLFNLESQEQELAAKMQDGHPRLVAVRQQMSELRDILDREPAEHVQTVEAINPSWQSLQLALANERTHANALTATEQALQTQLAQLHGDLIELNADEMNINQLTQQVALAESNHKEYAQRLEQARINRKLDDERISSLSLVQPASYVAAASGPRRVLVLALGLFLAACSGLATVLVAAWLNPLVQTAEQLAVLLEMPVVGTLPRSLLATAA
jgi:uncharacterized protein involved in exopolysaccharide biosynthesis